MKTAREVYEEFVRVYPDIFNRRAAVRKWCLEKSEDAALAAKLWKLLDMFEDCEDWDNDSTMCDADACIKEEEEKNKEA